jgi:septum formation protein
MAVILASASPRRQDLLRAAGIAVSVLPTNIPEVPMNGEKPKMFAERLAREKAWTIFKQRPMDHVIGADTIVVIDGQILGKPVNPSDAERMLRLLSGRTHEVTTGVCVMGPKANKAAEKPKAESLGNTRSETTRVTMNPLSEEEIRAYVATGEPMDKAGAYAVQGMASRWIPRVEGDYSNVVGLPIALVYRMLKEAGGI